MPRRKRGGAERETGRYTGSSMSKDGGGVGYRAGSLTGQSSRVQQDGVLSSPVVRSSLYFEAEERATRIAAENEELLGEMCKCKRPKPHRMTDQYQVGDVIIHEGYGRGIVAEIKGTHTMDVLFENDGKRKLMAYGHGSHL
jgi:hypothetical protein